METPLSFIRVHMLAFYELVTCYIITSLPLVRHVARCMKHIDGIFAVLSFLPKPGVPFFRVGECDGQVVQQVTLGANS